MSHAHQIPAQASDSNVIRPNAFRRFVPPTPEELKELRAHLKMSANAFAATFNFNPHTYREWELERGSPGRSATILLRMIMLEPKRMQTIMASLEP